MLWDDVSVELRPHTGKQKLTVAGRTTEVNVAFDQFEIWVQAPQSALDGKPPIMFGYAPWYSGDPILQRVQCGDWPDDLKAVIVKEANAALVAAGYAGGRTLAPIYGTWEKQQEEKPNESGDSDIDEPAMSTICH